MAKGMFELNNFFNPRKIHGITLIESLVFLAILVILASIAIPQVRKFYRIYKFNQYVSEVESTLKLARLLALERSISVSIYVEDSELKIYNSSTSLTPQSSGPLIRSIKIEPSDQSFISFEVSGFPILIDARGFIHPSNNPAELKVKRIDSVPCVKFEFKQMSGYINKKAC